MGGCGSRAWGVGCGWSLPNCPGSHASGFASSTIDHNGHNPPLKIVDALGEMHLLVTSIPCNDLYRLVSRTRSQQRSKDSRGLHSDASQPPSPPGDILIRSGDLWDFPRALLSLIESRFSSRGITISVPHRFLKMGVGTKFRLTSRNISATLQRVT